MIELFGIGMPARQGRWHFRGVSLRVETAELIAANSPFGVWMTKEVMWANLDAPNMEAAVHLENRTQILSLTTGDFREAAAAFAEKRAPRWSGWDD